MNKINLLAIPDYF